MTQSQAPAGQHGCARCTARWTGHNTSHCGACHETFTSNAPEVVGAVCGVELENRRDAEDERGRMTADMAEAFKKTRDEEQP